mmetsp:Transcript_265/g.596  ORF Transcript_265/g.596 Transcript_265/m.596 type:complete len:211 (-) Transcript_265:779-1411(-)
MKTRISITTSNQTQKQERATVDERIHTTGSTDNRERRDSDMTETYDTATSCRNRGTRRRGSVLTRSGTLKLNPQKDVSDNITPHYIPHSASSPCRGSQLLSTRTQPYIQTLSTLNTSQTNLPCRITPLPSHHPRVPQDPPQVPPLLPRELRRRSSSPRKEASQSLQLPALRGTEHHPTRLGLRLGLVLHLRGRRRLSVGKCSLHSFLATG